MSRGVDRFYRCLAASIDFIDVSRCLVTSIDVEVGWAPTRATTTTKLIDFIDVSRCLATSIDVEVGWPKASGKLTLRSSICGSSVLELAALK